MVGGCAVFLGRVHGGIRWTRGFDECDRLNHLPWSFNLVPPPQEFGVSKFFHLAAAPQKGWCPSFLSQIPGGGD